MIFGFQIQILAATVRVYGLILLLVGSFFLIPLTGSLASEQESASFQESPLSPLESPFSGIFPENTTEDDSQDMVPSEAEEVVADVEAIEVETPIRIGQTGSQTSMILVGAVLAGLAAVVGLVLVRRR